MAVTAKSAWRIFSAAPHRMCFFGGATALVVSMLWWTLILLARVGLPVVPPYAVPAVWVHAWLMVYGVFPFFVLGFLMTAFVRWIGAPPLAAGLYQPVALTLVAGYLLVLLGAPISAWLVATGMSLTVLAWLAGLVGLALRLKSHGPADSPHPPCALIILAVGLAGAVLSAWGAATGHWRALAAGPQLGVWGFLAPMVFIVSHRMLPFFAQAALPGYTAFRPTWAPPFAAAMFFAHAALLLAGLNAWLWLPDLPLALLGAWLLWRWQPWRARANPLLWSLFVAFFWLPVALALSCVQSLALVLADTAILGLAPLHVLAIGVLAGMVMAMATRVSLGHAGRALRMDRLGLGCFLILQLAVLARLLADIPQTGLHYGIWLVIAALLWLLAWTPWMLRYGRIYWLPRADGQPG